MNLTVTADPLNKHLTLNSHQLMEACGVLLWWLVEGTQPSLKDRLIDKYSWYMGPMEGGTLSAEGVYSYSGDPDLFPLASFVTKSENCFIFEYGIVGVFNKLDETTWVTRMD